MDRAKAASMRSRMRLLRQLAPQLRASQIEILYSVGLKPGQSQSELAISCDLTLSAISRAIDVMGVSGRKDRKGGKMGWIEVKRDPEDDRILQVFLTTKGERLIETLEEL